MPRHEYECIDCGLRLAGCENPATGKIHAYDRLPANPDNTVGRCLCMTCFEKRQEKGEPVHEPKPRRRYVRRVSTSVVDSPIQASVVAEVVDEPGPPSTAANSQWMP